MDYKEIIYRNYVKNHNESLYGEITLDKIKTNFSAWKFYFKKLLPNDKSVSILDIGCGDGSFIYFLNSIGYKNVHGIDISDQQIKQGERLGIKNILCCDLKSFLKENINKFDIIIARDVIEHFTKNQIFEIFMLVNTSLKTDGAFITQVPNGQGLFYTSIFYGDFTHEMAFTSSSLNQIYKNTGFSKAFYYPAGPVPNSIPACIRYLLWKLLIMGVKFFKMIATGRPVGIFTQNIISIGHK